MLSHVCFSLGDTLDWLLHLRETAAKSGTSNDRLARLLQIFGLLAVVAAGFWLRSLSPGQASRFVDWRPWAKTAAVTLYFSDGRFLFPVSRRLRANNQLPSAVLNALVAGPDTGSSLKNPIPSGMEIKSFDLYGPAPHPLPPPPHP